MKIEICGSDSKIECTLGELRRAFEAWEQDLVDGKCKSDEQEAAQTFDARVVGRTNCLLRYLLGIQ